MSTTLAADLQNIAQALEEEETPPEIDSLLEEVDGHVADLEKTLGIQLKAETVDGAYEEIGEILENEGLEPAQRAYIEAIGAHIRRAAGAIGRAIGRYHGTKARVRAGIRSIKRSFGAGRRAGYRRGASGAPKRRPGGRRRRKR